MKHRYSTQQNILRKQRGAALMVALVMLLITAMLGVAAMKTSIFSSKIATGTQVDAMSFEAAESALAIAFNEIGSSAGMTDLLDILEGAMYQRCLTKSDMAKSGACGSSDTMDHRGLIVATTRAAIRGMHPIDGSQVSTTAGGNIFVDYELGLLGESEVDSFSLSNHHAQEALRRGIKPGADVVEE